MTDAEAEQPIHLERMRSPEIASRVREGWRRVVFAVGAVEQHGPHLPVFVDAEHGTALATAVARKAGRTLVAPTVRVGCSAHHLDFAGTLSLRPETFQAVCRDLCESLARHGFREIWILPTHGGNFAPLREALADLRAAVGHAVDVRIYAEIMALMECWRAVVQAGSGMGSRVGGHADIAETSLMLALHPDLVRPDLAEPGFDTGLREEEFTRIISEGFAAVTPNGILGDARGGSAEMGWALIDALATQAVAGLRS